MMSKLKATVVGISTAAMLVTTPLMAAPVLVQPAAPVAAAATDAQIVEVRHEGRRWWRHRDRNRHGRWDGPRHHRHYYYGHRHRDRSGIGAGIAGLAMGAMIAGALSQPRAGYSDRDAYCASRYRSYNPRTGTYTTYDGRQVACR